MGIYLDIYYALRNSFRKRREDEGAFATADD